MNTANKKRIESIFIPLCLIVLGIVYYYPRLIMLEIPEYGDDTLIHLSRLVGFENVWESPVNYLMDENGTMINIFYPWLTMYPMWVIYKIFNDYVIAYNLYFLLLTVITLLLSFFSFKIITKDNISSFCSAVLYTYSSYRFMGVFRRSALGECISMAIMPIIILGIFYIFFSYYKKWYVLSIGMSLLAYSHLLSLYLTSIMITLFFVLSIFFISDRKERTIAFSKCVITSICLSLGALVPIIQISITNSIFHPDGNPNQLVRHSINIFEICKDSLNLYNQTGNSIGLLILIVLITNMGLILFLYKKINAFPTILMILSIIAFLISSDLLPWRYLSDYSCFKIIQFPWRMNAYTTLFSISAFSILTANIRKSVIIQYVMLFLVISLSVTLNSIALNDIHSENYVGIDNELINNMKIDFWDYSPNQLILYKVRNNNNNIQVVYLNDIPEDAQFYVSANGTEIHYFIDVLESGDLIDLPASWFSTVSVTENGMNVDSYMSERGTISFSSISNGSTEIIVKNKYTKLVYISWCISFLTLIGLVSKLFKTRNKEEVNDEIN